MATRAGVEEYSTSPSAQRSSERSIRASWTTGYWGADASIRASISTRFATTDATIPRASSLAPGSASTSARSRSRTAVGVRCPKSASNTAASATRRPARSDRIRSELRGSSSRLARHLRPDAVDEDADLLDVQPEHPLDRAPDRLADAAAGRGEIGAGAGDDPEANDDASGPDADDDGGPGKRGAPRRPAPGDAQDIGHLERGEARDLDDDAAADRQVGVDVEGARPPAPR